MIVRCIDNLFQTGVLIRSREYEVLGERDDCYILSGFDKGFSKTRFEIALSRGSSRGTPRGAAALRQVGGSATANKSQGASRPTSPQRSALRLTEWLHR
jgi:hypothetical protein